jgi:hypothetical protein
MAFPIHCCAIFIFIQNSHPFFAQGKLSLVIFSHPATSQKQRALADSFLTSRDDEN